MRRPFDEFVSSRGGVLWRTAWLLTGDATRAEQVLGTALARVWSSAGRHDGGPGGFDDEAVTALVRACVPRRRGDQPLAPTDWSAAARPGWTADDEATITERHELLAGLGLLTARQRAVVVLLHAERRTVPVAAAMLRLRTDAVEAVHAAAWAVLRSTPLLGPPGTDRAGSLPPAPAGGQGGARPEPAWPGREELERAEPDLAEPDLAEVHWLRSRLETGIPSPPYVPSWTADAETQGRRARRRSTLAVAAGTALLLAPLAVAGLRELAPDHVPPDATSPSAQPRSVVEAPVPPQCAALPPAGAAPAVPLDVENATVAWLRFCGPAFAPATAVVGSSLDAMVASWVGRPGVVHCPYQRPVDDGTARLQLGTDDGQIHVLDLVIGECGAVEVDGAPMEISGRAVFAQAVGALGSQLLEPLEPDQQAETFAVPHCPIDPLHPQPGARRTLPAYPSTDGLAMPLPAVTALVCRYEPTRGVLPRLVDSFQVGSGAAEQIRAAYLAHDRRAHAPCVDDPGPLFAAVLVDATGSWRSLGFDTGACDALVGPDHEVGTAGHWLVERVRYAVPAQFSVDGWRQPLGAIAPPDQ